MPTSQQQPDGSWAPAQPMGWQPGIDWEVTGTGRQRWGTAYLRNVVLASVPPGRFFRLRMARTDHRLRRWVRRNRLALDR